MATIPSMGNVADALSGGNFASKLAVDTSGISSIKTSLDGIKPPGVSAITDPSKLAGDLTKKTLDGINPSSLLDQAKAVKVPEITGLAGLTDATKGLSGGAFSAISSSMKPLAVGVPQNLKAINLKNAAETAAADAATSASSATDALSKASESLPNVTSATDVLSKTAAGLPNPAALASGVTNIPGGQNTIASIVNKSTGTTSGVSDTLASLNSVTKNASASALNKISTSSAASSAASSLLAGGALTGSGKALAGALTDPSGLIPKIPGVPAVPGVPSVDSLTKSLEVGKQPLSALASTGLPAGAAAALAASMNSLSTASPFPIKMPTVAEATVDRSELSTQISSQLGDSKIPAPNFTATGLSPASLNAIDARDKKRAEFFAAQKKYDEEYIVKRAALDIEKAKYVELRENYPVGDPTREAARAEVNGKIAVFTAWVEEQNALVTRLADEANKI
jgi:peptidyl-tRNA hydrolase